VKACLQSTCGTGQAVSTIHCSEGGKDQGALRDNEQIGVVSTLIALSGENSKADLRQIMCGHESNKRPLRSTGCPDSFLNNTIKREPRRNR
jgi:hypothetical protein